MVAGCVGAVRSGGSCRAAAGCRASRRGLCGMAAPGEKSSGDVGHHAACQHADGVADTAADADGCHPRLAGDHLRSVCPVAASAVDCLAGGGHVAGGALHRRVRRRGDPALPDGRGRQPAGTPRGDPGARARSHRRCHRGHDRRVDHPVDDSRCAPAWCQPAGLRRRGRAGDRAGRQAGAEQPDRRPADRADPADPAGRRGDHRRRVGPHRGNHRQLRGDAHLGRTTTGGAAELVHREPVPELDAYRLAADRHGVPDAGLPHAAGAVARRTEAAVP